MMNYIFDLDDTLMFSEVAKKKLYFDFVETLGVGDKAKKRAFDVLEETLYKTGERDLFDTAARTIIALYPDLEDKKDYKDPIFYCHREIDFFEEKYLTEIKEVEGATPLLEKLHSNGAYLGINTGGIISFAKRIVKGKNWPIPEKFVFGAGDTPDINPYSLQMKKNNIKYFVEEIILETEALFEDELANTTMVGDSYVDYQAAKEMGCNFIGVISRETSKLKDIEDIVKVRTLREIII